MAFALKRHIGAAIHRAIVEAAKANGLPVATHTGEARDVADSVAAGTATLEYGSFRYTI